MKGCQIGQGKLSIRKTSEGIGKETQKGAEGKAQAEKKKYPIARDTGNTGSPGTGRDPTGSTAREIGVCIAAFCKKRPAPLMAGLFIFGSLQKRLESVQKNRLKKV